MRKSKGAKVIEEVARKNGVSVAEVRMEMELAINAAMLSPDPVARAFWDNYLQSGRKPTPEEFIIYMANKIKADERLRG